MRRGLFPALVERSIGDTRARDPRDHALLILLAHSAQHLGLMKLLQAVPIAQKKVQHSPPLEPASRCYLSAICYFIHYFNVKQR